MSDAGVVDHAPARASAVLSIGALGTAVATVGLLGVPVGTLVAVAGVPFLLYGVLRGSRRGVSLGAFAVFGGVVLAGIVGAPPGPLLVGTAATVIAWDLGEQAINVGEQLGREARTVRGELVHAASGTVVGGLAIAAGYGVFALATGGQPLAALVLLLVAAIALVEAVRD